jgi:hypothetical protein
MTVKDALSQGGPVAGARPDHASSSIEVRGLLIFAMVLIGTAVVIHIVLGLVMGAFARSREEEPLQLDAPGRRVIEVDQFPAPRLQQNPAAELEQLKEEERRRLSAYGWIDRTGGIAFIPVDRAMDILAEKGLPKVPAPAALEGIPPRTSIPPATKREEPQDSSKRDGKP